VKRRVGRGQDVKEGRQKGDKVLTVREESRRQEDGSQLRGRPVVVSWSNGCLRLRRNGEGLFKWT
jgi:hypothetical protein